MNCERTFVLSRRIKLKYQIYITIEKNTRLTITINNTRRIFGENKINKRKKEILTNVDLDIWFLNLIEG